MPSQNDDQQRGAPQLEEERANARAEIMKDAMRVQQMARQEVAAQQADVSPRAIVAALDVYEVHRQRSQGWPMMPPPGLQVALHPSSVGREGQDPVMVTLNIRQTPEPDSVSPPRFLAHPLFELSDPGVHAAMQTAGVDEPSYRLAQQLQQRQPGEREILRIRLDLRVFVRQVDIDRRTRALQPAQLPPQAPPHNPYAASANSYVPAMPATGQRADARNGTTAPTPGPAGPPFRNITTVPAKGPVLGR